MIENPGPGDRIHRNAQYWASSWKPSVARTWKPAIRTDSGMLGNTWIDFYRWTSHGMLPLIAV